MRAVILAKNEEFIKSQNTDRSRTWTAGITIMSDRTEGEIKEMGLSNKELEEEDLDRGLTNMIRMNLELETEVLAPIRFCIFHYSSLG